MKIKSWTESIKYIERLNVVAHTVQNIELHNSYWFLPKISRDKVVRKLSQITFARRGGEVVSKIANKEQWGGIVKVQTYVVKKCQKCKHILWKLPNERGIKYVASVGRGEGVSPKDDLLYRP